MQVQVTDKSNSEEILSRYETAQCLLESATTNRIVKNDVVCAHWIKNTGCFWYEKRAGNGREFRLVNAKDFTNVEAFDHRLLAEMLTQSSGKEQNPDNLPLKNILLTLSPLELCFDLSDKRWVFSPEQKELKTLDSVPAGVLSPDGKKTAFVRDYNIGIRDIESGEENFLTLDGSPECAYASGIVPHAPVMDFLWSPDARFILTQRLDKRQMPSRLVVDYVPQGGSLLPQLTDANIGFAGEKYVEKFELFIVDVEYGELRPVQYRPVFYSGYSVASCLASGLSWWAKDGLRAYFVDIERGSKVVRIVELHVVTAETRVVFEEVGDPFVKLWYSNLEKPIFLPLPESDEVLWWSERSDWGHLYLYDLKTGELKKQVTHGQWLVREIVHFDPKRREVLIHTAGRDKEVSPYYRDVCKVNIDTGELKTLLNGNFDYAIYQYPFSSQCRMAAMQGREGSVTTVNGVSTDGDYLVTTRSRVDTVPETILLDRNGRELLSIETADVSGLPAGWVWPEPVKLKAADGKTDVYGVVYRPPGFSPDRAYPVIDFSLGYRICAGVAQGAFRGDNHYGLSYIWAVSLAALGFIVVAIEGRGTSYRNKSFQTHRYGDPGGTSDFDDRIAGMRQLAKQRPYMDLDRVGITGLDNEANTIYGMLDHPDFYKVGVIHCYSDPRFYSFPWAEQVEGVPLDGSTRANFQYAEERIHELKGKLLLTQGMLDVLSPAASFRLVDALYKSNKDFDMIFLPSVAHDVPVYVQRRTWDFLVRNLQGTEPPTDFCLRDWQELVAEND